MSNIGTQISHGKIFFGAGCQEQLPTAFSPSDKVLVLTDPGVSGAGIAGRVCDALKGGGISFVLFDEVGPEAPPECIYSAVKIYQDNGCTALLAVGGGSVIDASKTVGILLNNPGDLASFYAPGKVKNSVPPFIAIPTTAGTGSEITDVAVVNDQERKLKAVIKGGPLIQAKTIFLEPKNMAGIPAKVAAESGADALSHAMEALVSKGCQPFARGSALESIRLIFANLERFVNDSRDEDAATNMLIASSLAGYAFSNAGLGLAHGLAHPLGAHFHVGHGRACALYLPIVMRFNAEAAADQYRSAAQAMGLDSLGSSSEAVESAIVAVEELFARVGLPTTYQDTGVDFVFSSAMVEETMAMPIIHANPRAVTAEQIEALYKEPL